MPDSANSKLSLADLTLREIGFNALRGLHLDYTQRGRFSDITLTEHEVAKLAKIHRFHTQRSPIPVSIIHGISPRSGTNYILDLLRVHPDATFLRDALPEIPFLSTATNAMSLQAQFLQRYRGNERSLDRLDFLSHLAHGAMLHPHIEAGSTHALFKVPHAHHLNLFPALFPDYNLIICVRDGRDVVASSVKTWKGGLGRRSFSDYAREWARAARIIKNATDAFDQAGVKYKLVRYEDAFDAPVETARALCEFIASIQVPSPTTNIQKWMSVGLPRGGNPDRPIGRKKT